MTQKQNFYNRLKYAPFKFEQQDKEVPAYKHRNPDGSEGGWVAETALVEPTVHIDALAQVFEYATVTGNARICHEALICEFAEVSGNAIVDDYSLVCGNAKITDNAYIGGQSIIAGDSKVGGWRSTESEILDK